MDPPACLSVLQWTACCGFVEERWQDQHFGHSHPNRMQFFSSMRSGDRSRSNADRLVSLGQRDAGYNDGPFWNIGQRCLPRRKHTFLEDRAS